MKIRQLIVALKWISLLASTTSLYLLVYNLFQDYRFFSECLANGGHFNDWDSSFIRIRYTAGLPLGFLVIAFVLHEQQAKLTPKERASGLDIQ